MDDVRELETGFLAVPGPVADVRDWVADGAVSAHVVEGSPRWTLVVPVPEVDLPAPYDHPAALVAGRPLPAALLPAVGIFLVGTRGVVTVQRAALWRRIRWVSWAPGRGAERLPRLPLLRPAHLADAAPEGMPDARERLEHAFVQREGTGERFLRRIVTSLGLPGEQLVADPGAVRAVAGAHLVVPSEDALRRFAETTRGRVAVRAERHDDEESP